MSLRLLTCFLAVCGVHASTQPSSMSVEVSSEYYEVTTKMTWNSARTACKNKGDDLAIIQNEQQNLTATQKCTSGRCWIGLSRAKDGSFVWVDGTPKKFESWFGFEPNNQGGNENCVEMWTAKGGWNDLACFDMTNIGSALCERRYKITLTISAQQKTTLKVGEILNLDYQWAGGKVSRGSTYLGLTSAGMNSRLEAENQPMLVMVTVAAPAGTAKLTCVSPGYYDIKLFDSGKQLGDPIRIFCTTDGASQAWPVRGEAAPCSASATAVMVGEKGGLSSSVGNSTTTYALIGASLGSACLFAVTCCVFSRRKLREGYDTIE